MSTDRDPQHEDVDRPEDPDWWYEVLAERERVWQAREAAEERLREDLRRQRMDDYWTDYWARQRAPFWRRWFR